MADKIELGEVSINLHIDGAEEAAKQIEDLQDRLDRTQSELYSVQREYGRFKSESGLDEIKLRAEMGDRYKTNARIDLRNWLKSNAIAPDDSRVSKYFEMLNEGTTTYQSIISSIRKDFNLDIGGDGIGNIAEQIREMMASTGSGQGIGGLENLVSAMERLAQSLENLNFDKVTSGLKEILDIVTKISSKDFSNTFKIDSSSFQSIDDYVELAKGIMIESA